MRLQQLFVNLITISIFATASAMAQRQASISGTITTDDNDRVGFATVYLKNTNHSCMTNEQGVYTLQVDPGEYVLGVSAYGHQAVERSIKIIKDEMQTVDFVLKPLSIDLDEVVVMASGVGRVKRSPFNTIAVDTKEMHNTTKNLGESLSKAPGIKLRESGGVGSDMQLMLDGFSGKHVKIFIDGVPQEGVGNSFGLNNIPVNFAERIEVYKGVVPVNFGTDAIGGVVNIVTNKKRRRWFLDAAYSYGSFNTHKSHINFGQTLRSGFTYEVNAFQNYSDNNYSIDAAVEDFETGRIDKDKKVRVKRFNDTYHNEAIIGKIGVVGKSWADRFIFGLTYSQMYKDIQTGVRQEIVYGAKHRKGHSLMPSLEYSKRDLFTEGLDLSFTANYNRNVTTNADTSSYKYNWLGQTKLMNSPGEQSFQHQRANNDNWNGGLTLNYRIENKHFFTLSHVLNMFNRSNTSLLTKQEQTDPISKQTNKNISGIEYRFVPSDKWNVSAFGKYYDLSVSGPVATTTNKDDYVRQSRSMSSVGYGVAGTYFIVSDLQLKLSYEKAMRLPTIEEMFGDEDLEVGNIGIRPESSHNVNLNLSYNKVFGRHSIYLEGGIIYRNTIDYIQRNIESVGGGKYAAAYINYGKVLTTGYNLSLGYGFGDWLSIGGNFTHMNVTDNMKTALASQAVNVGYGQRMPNLPYIFADSYVTFYLRNFLKKGSTLTLTYDNQYLHSFSYYSSVIGSKNDEYIVPNQFSHNLALSYSMKNGRYNFVVECRNLTNENLYDNFSLQKAGRAFYGKFRVLLGN